MCSRWVSVFADNLSQIIRIREDMVKQMELQNKSINLILDSVKHIAMKLSELRNNLYTLDDSLTNSNGSYYSRMYDIVQVRASSTI